MTATRQLKIAIVAPESYPRLWGDFAGGLTQYVEAMAEGYAALGHNVHVFARADRHALARWRSAEVHYTKSPMFSGVLRPLSFILDEIRLWREFTQASRLRKFDLVEVVDWNVASLLTIACARHGPILVKLHGPSDFIARLNGTRVRGFARFIAWRERWTARRADLLLSADPTLARDVSRIWDLANQPKTVPDPVVVPRLSKRRERRGELRIISVGRLEHRKDQRTLIRALNRLIDVAASIPWTATIVGPDTRTGPGQSSYKAFLLREAAIAVRERVNWINGLPREKLWSLYLESDVAVVCTVDGAYGYATLDAMAAGLPVITTTPNRQTASPYVRHRANAWVYPAGNDQALADALLTLGRSPEIRSRLGAAAQRNVEQRFSPKTIAEEVLRHVDL